jgi:hypothetical protein
MANPQNGTSAGSFDALVSPQLTEQTQSSQDGKVQSAHPQFVFDMQKLIDGAKIVH